MAFNEFKYRMLVGLMEMAGQFVSGQLTKPNYEEQEKIQKEYYDNAKAIARKDEAKREKEIRKIAYKPPSEPEPEIETTEDLTEEKIEGGVACLPCIPPESLIITNPALKPISEVSIGDKVLDKTGGFSKVTKIMKRPYKGEIINVFTKYQNSPVTLTPEHPILTIMAQPCQLKQGYCLPGKQNPKCKNCKLKQKYQPFFMPAKKLFETKWKSNYTEPKLFLLIPRLRDTKDITELDLSKTISNIECRGKYVVPTKQIKDYKIGDKTYSSYKMVKGMLIKRKIRINSDFMKLIGFYLAEGHVTFQKRGGYLAFSFGKHEKRYIKEVTYLLNRVLGATGTIEEKKTAIAIRVGSRILAEMFSMLFGKGAANKKIPQWMLTLPIDKQKPLIEGYFRGDGYREKGKYNHFSCTTVSKDLASSIRLILHRMGIINGYRRYMAKTTSNIEGREIKHNYEQHVLSIWGPSAFALAKHMNYTPHPWAFRESHAAGIDENYIYLPVKKIERTPYNGMVMNLETIPNHTYAVEGICVSNCSSDHFSTVSGALSEALRFARTEGVRHPEVMRRLGLAKDELNAMERIDLSPENLVQLRGKEKKLAEWGLNASREIRHKITAIHSPADLEQVAADVAKIRTRFMRELWDVATVDGSIDKLCKGLKDEEREHCIRTINEVLNEKK